MPKVDKIRENEHEHDYDDSNRNDPTDAPANGVYEISTTSKHMKRLGIGELKVTKNLGSDIYEAIDLFGADSVYSLYRQKAVILVQDIVRGNATTIVKDADGKTAKDDNGDDLHEVGLSLDEIQTLVNERKFSVLPVRGKSKGEKLARDVGKMEDLEEIAKLEAAIAARKQALGIEA